MHTRSDRNPDVISPDEFVTSPAQAGTEVAVMAPRARK
jgi:hypothetical protein